MAGATIHMTANKQRTLQEIHEKIHYIEGAEQISKSAQAINGVTIWTLVYEKFYFRVGSYTSVTIVLTEHGQEQTACVVAAGGGEGVVNYSYGANRNFAKACVQMLETCGFTVMDSDLDMHSKGIFQRIFR
jgi:hypothetical protein